MLAPSTIRKARGVAVDTEHVAPVRKRQRRQSISIPSPISPTPLHDNEEHISPIPAPASSTSLPDKQDFLNLIIPDLPIPFSTILTSTGADVDHSTPFLQLPPLDIAEFCADDSNSNLSLPPPPQPKSPLHDLPMANFTPPPPINLDEARVHSVEESTPDVAIPFYTIINKGSIKQKLIVTDSLGFRYSCQLKTRKTCTWKCTARAGKLHVPCRASVRQKIFPDMNSNINYNQSDFIFKPHSNEENHSHPPKLGIESHVLFYRDGKAASLQDKFRGPQDIVNDLLKNRPDLPGSHVPDIQNLKKAISRARAKAPLK